MNEYLSRLGGLKIAKLLNDNTDEFDGLHFFMHLRTTKTHLQFQAYAFLPSRVKFKFYLEKDNLQVWNCLFPNYVKARRVDILKLVIKHVEPTLQLLVTTNKQLTKNLVIDLLNRSSSLYNYITNPITFFDTPPNIEFRAGKAINPLNIPVTLIIQGKRKGVLTTLKRQGTFHLGKAQKPFKSNWFAPPNTKEDYQVVKGVIQEIFQYLNDSNMENKLTARQEATHET